MKEFRAGCGAINARRAGAAGKPARENHRRESRSCGARGRAVPTVANPASARGALPERPAAACGPPRTTLAHSQHDGIRRSPRPYARGDRLPALASSTSTRWPTSHCTAESPATRVRPPRSRSRRHRPSRPAPRRRRLRPTARGRPSRSRRSPEVRNALHAAPGDHRRTPPADCLRARRATDSRSSPSRSSPAFGLRLCPWKQLRVGGGARCEPTHAWRTRPVLLIGNCHRFSPGGCPGSPARRLLVIPQRAPAVPDSCPCRPTGATEAACGPCSPSSSTNRTSVPTVRSSNPPRTTLLRWK